MTAAVRYAVARPTGWVTDEVASYVAALPDGELLVLSGIAGVIWDVLATADHPITAAEIAAEVAEEVTPEVLGQVSDFLVDLTTRAVLATT